MANCEPFSHEYRFIVQETHLDVFGHMNHAVYLEVLEEARWDLITQMGQGLKEILQTKIGPVVLEVHITYKKELTARSKVVIKTSGGGYKNRLAMVLNQEMILENGDVACRAEIVFGLFDMNRRKLIPPTSEWEKVIGKMA